eukprot:CAMPEP_0194049804 /NCGR_PEP_ID=MMETSP0009_2-20130614/31087_1 /TAXON_ID=210454 /ORGANISM="Grammatophora oceanica, Strain CCMP 410" /LENGTH=215 /DNA_ID=CAMNT_0038696043 /DNA_START=81 /DNA_END=728 /DNA_ORIENTATION=-
MTVAGGAFAFLHPPIPLLEIRILDVWLLLGTGALYEFVTCLMTLLLKKRSSKEINLEATLVQVKFETAKKRKLGPSAFVETSKLERQILSTEKQLEQLKAKRFASANQLTKIVSRLQLLLWLGTFIFYFSLPVLKIDGVQVAAMQDKLEELSLDDPDQAASGFLQGFFFPLSFIGIGFKVAKLGVGKAAIGALVVLWSGQVFVKKIMDGVEALLV